MAYPNDPLVSIIILNFNGQNYIEKCLFSVLNSNYKNIEVIFVDNASTDDSLLIVQKQFATDKRLKVLKNGENLGFSEGNNFGFSHARGDYVVLLNNDTIADPFWLNALVSTMMNDKTIGLAGSTILSIDGKRLRGAGGFWSDYLLFLCPIGAGRLADFEFIPTFEVSFASGCALIASKEFLSEIGLFDPKIPYNYDDTLLGVKTWIAGKRVVSVSGSKVCHIGGATLKKFWDNESVRFSLLRAKMCLLFDIYFKLKDLIKAWTIFSISLCIESIVCVRTNNLPTIVANVRAFSWIFKNFRHVWNNRLNHWKNPKISPEALMNKVIRIKLGFPLCVANSNLTYSRYKQECLKMENPLVRQPKLLNT